MMQTEEKTMEMSMPMQDSMGNMVKKQEVINKLQMVTIPMINTDRKQEVIRLMAQLLCNTINMDLKLAHSKRIQMV